MASQRSYSLQEKASILREIDGRGLPRLCDVARELGTSISALSRILKEREAIGRALAGGGLQAEGPPPGPPSAARKALTREQKAWVVQQVESAGGPSCLRGLSERLGVSISSLSVILKERREARAPPAARTQQEGRSWCSWAAKGWWSGVRARRWRWSLSGLCKGAILRAVAGREGENLRELSAGLRVSISTLSRVLKERDGAARRRLRAN